MSAKRDVCRSVQGLTAERAREVLVYEPSTGKLFWRNDVFKGPRAGTLAGNIHPNGYWRVRIDGVTHLAHRVIWLHVHGSWPRHQIDHINGSRADNRIANLRDVDNRTNSENKRKPNSRNVTGFMGVVKHRKRFKAVIRVMDQGVHIGVFDDPMEAHHAYIQAKRSLHKGCTL